MGIVIAGIVGAGLEPQFAIGPKWFPGLSQNRMIGLAIFGFLALWLLRSAKPVKQ
jgi:hypothetical protein